MNVRKEIYALILYEAEKAAKKAESDLRFNRHEINRLAKEQHRLKSRKSEAYRIVEELKKAVAVSTKKG